MSAIRDAWLLSGLVLAMAVTSANAGVVLQQNFDDTTLFDPTVSIERTIGDPNTIGGQWGPFDYVVDAGMNYGPWVVNDGSAANAAQVGPAHSGTQSVGFKTLFPGGDAGYLQIIGRVNNGVPATENYEVSFYYRPDDQWSSTMLTVGGDYIGANPQPIDLRVAFESGTRSINLLYRNPGAAQGQGFWIPSGIRFVEDTWMKIRVVADVKGTNEYNIFVTPEGETEIEGQQPVPLHMEGQREEIWQLDLSRQGGTGLINYFDDFLITSPGVPDAKPGDYNLDGKVDAADYVVWRKDPASYGGDPAGYVAWRQNFGSTAGSGASQDSSSPAPEPTSFLLFASAVTLAGVWKRRRN